MFPKSLISLLVLIAAVLRFGDSATCKSTSWARFQDEYCAQAYPDHSFRTFQEAQSFCVTGTSTLLIINSKEYAEFIRDNVFTGSGMYDTIWIGAHKPNGTEHFIWIDGSPLIYNNWADSNPRENTVGDRCVEIRSPNSIVADAKWYDVPCGKKNMMVCQTNMVWTLDYTVGEVIKLRNRVTALEERIALDD